MYLKLIEEICKELNIKYNLLCKDWIIKLEKDNKLRIISGYKFDLNSSGVSYLVDDKYAVYELLKLNNLPIIEHILLYDENNPYLYAKDCKDRSIAFNYYNLYKKIVLKGNTGTCGRSVYKIDDLKQIDKTLDILFKNNYSISICPFYEIEDEYRLIVLDNEIKFVYSKKRPIVYGDGKKYLSELLHEFNPSFKYKIDNDYILKENEKYIYSWKHNLSNGATINTLIDNKEVLENLALKVAKCLNLRFGSIDIIKVNNEYLVLECNSGVMMDNFIKILPDGYKIAKSIYKEAILKMFE